MLVQLHVNDATVSGKIQNRGTITGTGNAEFTGTVVNERVGKIESGKFKRIEDASTAGVCNAVEYEAYVKLIGHRWPDESTLRAIQDKAYGNAQLKFPSYVTPNDMENTLTIPEGVTVTVDLTGKQVAGKDAEKKIINHGNLTLIDSGTGGTLNIPIENYGTLNANGGTVTGEVTNKGTITTTGEKTTQFSGGVTNESNGKIENGTFSGKVTNNGAINDGTFSGNVTNNGTIGNGNFIGAVTNEKTGVISGGKFDESKLTNNGGTLPPKPGDNKPDDTNKDNDKKEDTYDLTVKNAEVTVKDADGKAVEFTKAEDGTLTAKVPENAEVTVKYTAPTDAIVFDLWSINSDAKLDVNVKPAVGAEYTLSTCQLDFCLPAKFHLTYVDKDGTEKTPVVLHRAILGSLDRFMAYLIEETKGKFPTWLAPVQVKVLPVSEKTLEYSEAITEKLVEAGIRVALDDDNQKIGYKIRAAQQVDRVPYMLVLGAKEAEAGNVSVRDRKGETTTMEVDEFIAKVTAEIKNRSL